LLLLVCIVGALVSLWQSPLKWGRGLLIKESAGRRPLVLNERAERMDRFHHARTSLPPFGAAREGTIM
jgi:hypothetical protein